MTRAEYEALDGENFSALREIEAAPLKYKLAKQAPREATDAMDLGTVAHIATTQPESLKERVAVWAEGVRRGKAWEQFESLAKHDGKIILRAEDYERALSMAHAVRSSPQAKPYLVGGVAEQPMQWELKDPVLGFVTKCKGIPDYETDTHIVDLKFVRSSAIEAFGRQMFDSRAHAQLAFYRAGRRVLSGVTKQCVLIACENTGSNIVQVYRLTEEQLTQGEGLFSAWLATLHQCKQTNVWGGYWPTETDLVFPKWSREEEIDQ
jgi:hypothetical protein